MSLLLVSAAIAQEIVLHSFAADRFEGVTPLLHAADAYGKVLLLLIMTRRYV